VVQAALVAYRAAGIALPRTIYSMLGSWRLVRVSKAGAQRGDLAFIGPLAGARLPAQQGRRQRPRKVVGMPRAHDSYRCHEQAGRGRQTARAHQKEI
jgi:hypothetical protein